MDHAADKPKIKRGDSKKRLSTHGIRGGGAGAVARGGGESKANRKGKKQASQDPCASSGTVGRVENRKCWIITKPQVDPIDVHKN